MGGGCPAPPWALHQADGPGRRPKGPLPLSVALVSHGVPYRACPITSMPSERASPHVHAPAPSSVPPWLCVPRGCTCPSGCARLRALCCVSPGPVPWWQHSGDPWSSPQSLPSLPLPLLGDFPLQPLCWAAWDGVNLPCSPCRAVLCTGSWNSTGTTPVQCLLLHAAGTASGPPPSLFFSPSPFSL